MELDLSFPLPWIGVVRLNLVLSVSSLFLFLTSIGACLVWQDLESEGPLAQILERVLPYRRLCPPTGDFSAGLLEGLVRIILR